MVLFCSVEVSSIMKILHLSDDKLPTDWRIEKSGITALNHGHEVVFAGKNSVEYQTNTFSKKYVIDWTEKSRRGFPFYWHICVENK